MTARNKKILATIKNWSPEERMSLAEDIHDTIFPRNKAIDREWAKECDRRAELVMAGEMKLIPAGKVLKHYRRSHSNPRKTR